MDKRNLLRSALALALAATFSTATLAQDKPLKIGVTAGPHAQIFEQVKKIAERDGLKIQIVEFSDYVQPNAALAAGELDANSYQHKPYLDQQVKDRGYKIVPVGYTVNFPIGIYSKKVKSLKAIGRAVRPAGDPPVSAAPQVAAPPAESTAPPPPALEPLPKPPEALRPASSPAA